MHSGFLKARFTIDNLVRLSEDMYKAMQRRRKVIAVFTDLDRAYERLDHVLGD